MAIFMLKTNWNFLWDKYGLHCCFYKSCLQVKKIKNKNSDTFISIRLTLKWQHFQSANCPPINFSFSWLYHVLYDPLLLCCYSHLMEMMSILEIQLISVCFVALQRSRKKFGKMKENTKIKQKRKEDSN